MSDKPIPVSVGDVVRMDWSKAFGADYERASVFRVLDITRRFGSSGPLLKLGFVPGYEYSDADRDCPYCDQYFVAEVLEYPKWSPVMKPNAFRGVRQHIPARGRYTGCVLELIGQIIGRMNISAETRLDEFKTLDLIRNAAGLVKDRRLGSTRVTVNIKPFRKWVQKNYTKMLTTVADAHLQALEDEEDRMRDFEADMRADFEKEAMRDLVAETECHEPVEYAE